MVSDQRKTYKFTEDGEASNLIEFYKKKLGLSAEEVVLNFLPKSDTDFFEHEWDVFKQSIIKCIPEDSPTHDFLIELERLYLIGIVGHNKIPFTIIEHIKTEYGIEKIISSYDGD